MMQAQMPKEKPKIQENEIHQIAEEIHKKLMNLDPNSNIRVYISDTSGEGRFVGKSFDTKSVFGANKFTPYYQTQYGQFRGALINLYRDNFYYGMEVNENTVEDFFETLKDTLIKREKGETLNDEEKKLSEAFDSAMSEFNLRVALSSSNNTLYISVYPEEDKGKLVPVPVTKTEEDNKPQFKSFGEMGERAMQKAREHNQSIKKLLEQEGI